MCHKGYGVWMKSGILGCAKQSNIKLDKRREKVYVNSKFWSKQHERASYLKLEGQHYLKLEEHSCNLLHAWTFELPKQAMLQPVNMLSTICTGRSSTVCILNIHLISLLCMYSFMVLFFLHSHSEPLLSYNVGSFVPTIIGVTSATGLHCNIGLTPLDIPFVRFTPSPPQCNMKLTCFLSLIVLTMGL